MLEPHLFALHSLTLRQMAEPAQLADIVGVPASELASELEKAEADGTVLSRKGKYMISPGGREALDAAYPVAFADLRSSSAVAEAIESFETGVNRQILDLTTQWQMRDVGGEQVPNDHSDTGYDDAIIDRVGRVIEKTGRVLRPIADADPLVDRFLERLGGALTRAEGGETDYVSGLRVDSVHTVWFQMHEHLLRLTGRGAPGMTVAETYRWLVVPDDPAVEPSRDLVGGKAWSLWRMRSLGLRVPPAFVVTTEACRAFFDGGRSLPEGLAAELESGIRLLERELGRTFGGGDRPLLVSVRSGAAISMPGMMDTILDLGCTDDVERALAAETGDPAFAAEVHRRFAGFYGRLVLGCTEELDDLPDTASVRAAIRDDTGGSVPSDPWEQLHGAVASVFASSRSRRAVAYRKHYGIPDDLGTAVTVQAMVFGNLDDDSGTGVLFTRDPSTGAREPFGEYLERGQGEDVVSGRVTPEPLSTLASRLPDVHAELLTAADRLDAEGRDAQDIEFTVQRGTLFLLQSRPAKRTARAAVRIATTLVDEGTLTPADAVGRVTAEQARTLLRPQLAPGAADGARTLARGTAACPGVATGVAVATPEEAQDTPDAVLVRHSTSPDDVHGMIAAVAVVTEQGGATSHAAVVSRALDTPCVVGCGAGTVEALAGREVTVDATSGTIYFGPLATTAVSEDGDGDLARLADWASEIAPVRVAASGPEPVFDADALPPDEVGDAIPAIPAGTRTVRGAVFTSPDGVRAAVDAGVEVIVSTVRLPVLLAAVHHGGKR